MADKNRRFGFLGNVTDFIQAVNDRVGGGIVRSGIRLGAFAADPFIKGNQRKSAEDFINRFEEQRKREGGIGYYDESSVGGRVGRGFGTGVKAGVDIVGIGKAVKGGQYLGRAASSDGGRKVLSFLGGTTAGSTASNLQVRGTGEDPDLKRDIATGAAIDLLLPGAGKLVTKLRTRFGKDVSSRLARATDPKEARAVLKKVLPEADDAMIDRAAQAVTKEGDRKKIVDTVAESLDDSDEISHITKASNTDSIIKDGRLKPNAPPVEGYEGQNAVFMQKGRKNPYGFPDEDNINIVYDRKKVSNNVIENGDELAVEGDLPLDSVKYVEVPNEEVAKKFQARGIETRVNPELAYKQPREIGEDVIEPTKSIIEPVNPQSKPITSSRVGSAKEQILGQLKTSRQAAQEADIDVKGVEKFRKKISSKTEAAQSQIFDRLDPLKKLQDEVERSTGEKLPETARAYDRARLFAGLPEATQQKFKEVETVLDNFRGGGGDLDDLRAYGVAKQIVEDRPGGAAISEIDAQKAIDEITSKMSPAQLEALEGSRQAIVDYNHNLLEGIHQSGLISDDAFKAILENNQNYFSPHQVVKYVLEDLEKGGKVFGRSGSYNVAKQNLLKLRQGVAEGTEILDPVEATITNTDRVLRTTWKNEVGNALGELTDIAKRGGLDIAIKLRNADDVVARNLLYSDAAEFRGVRNSVAKSIKKNNKVARKLQSELLKLSDEFAVKAKRTDIQRLGKEGEDDAIAALKDLKGKDLRETYNILLDYQDYQFERIRKKVVGRNKELAGVMDEIAVLRGEYETARSQVKDLVGEARKLADREVPDGYERVSYFRNGIREDVALPTELAEVYKGLNKEQADVVSKAVSQTSRLLKAGATSLNIPFLLLKNPIRDFKTMALNSKNIKLNQLGKYYVKGIAEAFKGVFKNSSELYSRWVAEGGSGVGLYREGTDVAEKLTRKYTASTGDKIGFYIKNPADLFEAITSPIRRVGEAIEATPRLAEFQAALDNKASGQTAALAARDVTVDFARSGKVGQIANMWVPFLNARLQGTEKLYRAFKENPSRAIGIYSAMTALPLAATYAWNEQNHKEVLAQIPQDVKDKNFVIVLGNGKDKDGNLTQVIKIPKNELDQILGNPLEEFMKFVAKDDPKALDRIAREFVSNISPQEIVKDGEFSGSRAISGLPPIIRTPAENVANRSFYFDRPLVPENMQDLPRDRQVDDNTSMAARFVAGITGQSPIIAENTLRGFSGNLLTSSPVGGLKDTVAGTRGTEPTNRFYKSLDKTKRLKAAADDDINEAIKTGDYVKARQIASDYNEALKREFKPWAKRYGQFATPELIEAYNDQKIRLTRSSVAQRRLNIIKKARKEAQNG